MQIEEKKREEKSYYFFAGGAPRNILPYCENDLFEVKYESKMNLLFKYINEIFNDNNKIKENQIKKSKYSISDYNLIIRNCIIINLIKSIILNTFCQNKIYVLFFFKDSIISLTIKRIDENALFRKEKYKNFTNIKCNKKFYINGNQQDKIADKYYYNQTDNFIELIWDNNINNCLCIFYNKTEINLYKYNMRYMLSTCSLVSSLDLPSCNNSHVKYIEYMLGVSDTLEYINLINFDEKKLYNDGFVIRINKIINKYKLYIQIKYNLKSHNIYCKYNLISKKKYII